MSYLIYAIVFFIIYYIVEQKILRGSLVRAAKKLSKLYNFSGEISSHDLRSLRKETNFYKLHRDRMVFELLITEKPDLSITDLDYKDLARFKKIIENYQNNVLCHYDFFSHKNISI